MSNASGGPVVVTGSTAAVGRLVCAAAVGEDIDLQQVTAEEARAFYRAQGGFAGANADFLFGFESYDGVEGATDEPQDTSVADDDYLDLSRITGQRPRSYQQWAHDHAADFTGPPS